jgi:hypothetical protein
MGTPALLPLPAATDLALLGATRRVASPVALNSGVKMTPPPSSGATVPLPSVSCAEASAPGTGSPFTSRSSGASVSGVRKSAVFLGVVKALAGVGCLGSVG